MSSITQFLFDLGHEEAFPTPTVFNLSGIDLAPDEISLLEKGLKFVPTPQKVDNLELKADYYTIAHKLKWKFVPKSNNNMINNNNKDLIRLKTNSKAAPQPSNANQQLLCNQLEKLSTIKKSFKGKPKYNMSPKLYAALKSLENGRFVIKEADKGSGVVIMTEEFYNGKILQMLESSNYKEVQLDCSTLVKRVVSFIKPFKDQLSKTEFDAITKQESCLANFYGLPKLHKSKLVQDAVEIQINCPNPHDLQFRPIVACQNCPTSFLADLLDKLLRPFVEKVKFRLKDTWDFLRKLPETAKNDEFSVTGDISALYTNITTEKGEAAILYYYNQYPNLLPNSFSKEFLVKLYNFCQNNLFFRFRDKV